MRIQDRYQGYVLYQLWGKAIDKRVRMRMQKIMISLICLGILLVGIVMVPSVFAGDGCGPGTVLVDGVCELAETSGTSIPPLYIAGGAAVIGGAVIGIVFVVKRGSSGTSAPKPAREELEEYESRYVARKPAEKKETSMFCDNCGAAFKKSEAKICGKCGTPHS